MIEFLEFDSSVFGYRVGKILDSKVNIQEVISKAKLDGFKLLYGFVNPVNSKQNQSYLSNKGLLVDEKLTFFRNVPVLCNIQNEIEILDFIDISENLIALGLQSGEFSRFRMDVNFKNDEFPKLYRIWMEKSLSGEICKKILVQKDNQKIIAFLTIALKNNHADLGLMAVDFDYRRRKISEKLIKSAFYECKNMNLTQIQVSTQKANTTACNLFQKLGFEIEKVENIYHFWL